MEYVAGGIVLLVVVLAILSTLGKKSAVDVLVTQYGLSRAMLDQLSGTEIARLKSSIKSLEDSRDSKALKKLVEQYKLTE
jgi:hypothetical protein